MSWKFYGGLSAVNERNIMRPLLICGLAALLLVPAAFANNSQPLAFYTSFISIQSNVSQQPGVVNPSKTSATNGCLWDATDYVQRDAVLNSSLTSKASVTDTVCIYSDSTDRMVTTEIAADSPNMNLAIQLSTGATYAIAPIFDKRLGLWSYRTCINLPTYQAGEPALQPITGSNGGIAAPTTVSLTAATTSSKQIAKIRYDWRIAAGSCLPG